MHRIALRHFAVSFVLIFAVLVSAQEKKPTYQLRVRAETESAIYEQGENAAFQVRLLEDGKPLAGKEISYVIQGDGNFWKKGTVTSTESVAIIEATLSCPGFLRCSVSWNDAPNGKISALGGAGFAPLEIRAETPEPADFDEFWNDKKAALAKLPMNPKLDPVPAEKVNNLNVQVFDIKVDCLGGKPVSGYFAKPVDAKPKSLPIIISYHGAGVQSAYMPIGNAARGALALDVNAHGIENGQPNEFYKALANGELKDYPTFGGNDREKLYFVGMFIRVFRSLQFMKSQPEWDGKTIAVTGASQGGGQSLVAAGGDPDVTFCIAYVPAICYPTGDIEGNFGGWPGFLGGKTKVNADPAVVKNVPYIDAANFAKRIKAESILSTGFIDTVCSSTSVYVAFNNITAKKQILPTPETDHGTPSQTIATANKLMWEYIERNRAAK